MLSMSASKPAKIYIVASLPMMVPSSLGEDEVNGMGGTPTPPPPEGRSGF